MDGKGEERKIIEKERMKSRGKEGIKKEEKRVKGRQRWRNGNSDVSIKCSNTLNVFPFFIIDP